RRCVSLYFRVFRHFFFQAEDGIRDDLVTGVQTCALPIFYAEHPFTNVAKKYLVPNFGSRTVSMLDATEPTVMATMPGDMESFGRSEERRVGKGGGSRVWPQGASKRGKPAGGRRENENERR